MTLESYLNGSWISGKGTATEVVDPTSGAVVATCCSQGLDRGKALAYARSTGGPALRTLTFAERGEMLAGLANALHEHREELLALSCQTSGTTRGDAKFDVDGAMGTLQVYASIGRKLGDKKVLVDGDAKSVLRSKRFVGQHVFASKTGVAIHINAFNFPAWGMAEKAAVAWLSGMPVLSKPGTSTAAVAARVAQIWVDTGLLPQGAFSFLVGGVGDLLDHLGPQDCVAFTGSAATGQKVRSHPAVIRTNARVNIEADSVNASVLGPDVAATSDTARMFINDAARDQFQKAGQKCTAIRRLFVPRESADDVVAALIERLEGVVVGDPNTKGTEVGPVASAAQQQSVEQGVASLRAEAEVAWEAPAPASGGCFVAPTLFRVDADNAGPFVHEHEVFGPVATVITYSGDAADAVDLVARGGGSLVCSVYSDDVAWGGDVVLGLAPWHGRIQWGSKKVHDQGAGPGAVLAPFVHGGPGKAGGGEELGGERALQFYMQRTAIQADRGLLERMLANHGG